MKAMAMQKNPSLSSWIVQGELVKAFPYLCLAAEADDPEARFHYGVKHGAEMALELYASMQCADVCVPGILAPVKT